MARVGFEDGSIHFTYYPDEEPSINTFYKGISNVCGLAVT